MRVVYRPDEESKASPIDYLERWYLHIAFFADQVRFLGVVPTPDGNRLIIEQPAIAGIPATSEAQIRDFFIGNGWNPSLRMKRQLFSILKMVSPFPTPTEATSFSCRTVYLLP
jgi:hypothetical protein